jgi:hypothetical protein
MIDQVVRFAGIRAVGTVVQPRQLHLELAEAVRFLRGSTAGTAQLPWPDLRPCLASFGTGEQVAGALKQLLLPLDQQERRHCVVGGNLLQWLAATDRLHSDQPRAEAFGEVLELGAVGVALTQLLRRRLRQQCEHLHRGGAPLQWLAVGPVQKIQTT